MTDVKNLVGLKLPALTLRATDGSDVDLSASSGLVVVYAYPRTSSPDGAAIEGWDLIPGARGCTPQSCAFRDHFSELKAVGLVRCLGCLLSLQNIS